MDSEPQSTMPNDRQAVLCPSSKVSGVLGASPPQPSTPFSNQSELSVGMATKPNEFTEPLEKALGAAAATCNALSIGLPYPIADLSRVSPSRAPDGENLRYLAPQMADTANDRQPQIGRHEKAAALGTLPPPSVRCMPSLSSPFSSSTLTGGFASQVPRELPWLDGSDYQILYKQISQQAFNGYECIEQDMVRPAYRIPNNSIRAALRYLDGVVPRASALAENQLYLKSYVGLGKTELLGFSQRPQGLTLGEAIQKLYMSRLHDSNNLLPMTKVYEGGWSPAISSKKYPKKAGTVWLGDVVDSVNIERLRANNITAMVSVHPKDFRSIGQEKHGKDGEDASTSPIRWHLQLQLADSKETDLESKFDEIFAFMHSLVVDEGHNLLVHCIAGLSRSVAVVRDFIQRIEVERGIIDMTGTSAERYSRMKASREVIFQRLRKIRPGITENNFKEQLDNSTKRICGVSRQLKAVASSRQNSKEHGGGGYLADSVAMVFFFYRLRPTSRVVQLFEDRRVNHARKEKALGQMQNGFSFPARLRQWFEDCTQYLSSGN